MSMSKTSSKKTSQSKPIDKKSFYEKIFEHGRRLNLSNDRLKEKYLSKLDGTQASFDRVIKDLESQKDLTQQPLDDLVAWRNSAHDRITVYNVELKKETAAYEKLINETLIKIGKLRDKRYKTVLWYRSLGKVISDRIKGVRFSDRVLTHD